MGKTAELWEKLLTLKRQFRGSQPNDAITYKLNVFGMHVKGKSAWIYMMLPMFLAIAYVGCVVSLYAFDALLGVPEFSWINTVWWMIVLATLQVVFKGGSD